MRLYKANPCEIKSLKSLVKKAGGVYYGVEMKGCAHYRVYNIR